MDEADAYRADLEGVAYLERLGYERLAGLGCHPSTAGASPRFSRRDG